MRIPARIPLDTEIPIQVPAELERELQTAVDGRRDDQAERLTAMRRRWADNLRKLVHEFRSSGLPLRTQALVQQAVKAVAERIERMGQE